jgi:micrococcal nuclease
MTLLVDRTPIRMRLANIDAPEKSQVYGQRSKQSLSDMCWGKDAQYDAQTKDRYGRAVATVRCGGVEVNQAQVERGMAWTYTQYNKNPALSGIEKASRDKRIGLWADTKPTAPWDFRHAKKASQKSLLSGVPCHVGPRGGHYMMVNGHKRYGC